MPSKSKNNSTWERQPGESPQAYEAFVSYRDMGVERSVRAVGQRLDKSRTQIGKWSSAWKWVVRARTWDNELDRAARAKAVKKAGEMKDRHVNLAMQLQKKALEALEDVDMASPAARNLLMFIEKATTLERLNRLEQAGIAPDGKGAQTSADSGSRSLAEVIMEAYARRKEDDDND